jgi:hypothetical protein
MTYVGKVGEIVLLITSCFWLLGVVVVSHNCFYDICFFVFVILGYWLCFHSVYYVIYASFIAGPGVRAVYGWFVYIYGGGGG